MILWSLGTLPPVVPPLQPGSTCGLFFKMSLRTMSQHQNRDTGMVSQFLDQGFGKDASEKMVLSIDKGNHIAIAAFDKCVYSLLHFYVR